MTPCGMCALSLDHRPRPFARRRADRRDPRPWPRVAIAGVRTASRHIVTSVTKSAQGARIDVYGTAAHSLSRASRGRPPVRRSPTTRAGAPRAKRRSTVSRDSAASTNRNGSRIAASAASVPAAADGRSERTPSDASLTDDRPERAAPRCARATAATATARPRRRCVPVAGRSNLRRSRPTRRPAACRRKPSRARRTRKTPRSMDQAPASSPVATSHRPGDGDQCHRAPCPPTMRPVWRGSDRRSPTTGTRAGPVRRPWDSREGG